MGMRSYGSPRTGYGITIASNSATVLSVVAKDSFHICKINVGIPIGAANQIFRFCAGNSSATAGFWGSGGSAPAAYIFDAGDEGLNLGKGNDFFFKSSGASATIWYSYSGYVR